MATEQPSLGIKRAQMDVAMSTVGSSDKSAKCIRMQLREVFVRLFWRFTLINSIKSCFVFKIHHTVIKRAQMCDFVDYRACIQRHLVGKTKT